MVPGNTAISAPMLPREREISLAHAQRYNFLIMEQCCGSLSVEMIPRKHCGFSTYLTKCARARSGACAEVQFTDYGSVLWSPGSRNGSREALRFQNISCQASESSVWSMSEVQFPDYGTELWSPISRIYSRKALRFQHLTCQNSESSGWRMRRGAIT
jgi:hypothetical protein